MRLETFNSQKSTFLSLRKHECGKQTLSQQKRGAESSATRGDSIHSLSRFIASLLYNFHRCQRAAGDQSSSFLCQIEPSYGRRLLSRLVSTMSLIYNWIELSLSGLYDVHNISLVLLVRNIYRVVKTAASTDTIKKSLQKHEKHEKHESELINQQRRLQSNCFLQPDVA